MMMRPMKLAGSQLLFGDGCLAFLKDVGAKRAMIVTGGSSMKRCGILDQAAARCSTSTSSRPMAENG